MPFDDFGAPPEWRPVPRPAEAPERAWSGRDTMVAVSIMLLLAVITLGECRLLLGFWHELGHAA